MGFPWISKASLVALLVNPIAIDNMSNNEGLREFLELSHSRWKQGWEATEAQRSRSAVDFPRSQRPPVPHQLLDIDFPNGGLIVQNKKSMVHSDLWVLQTWQSHTITLFIPRRRQNYLFRELMKSQYSTLPEHSWLWRSRTTQWMQYW